MTNTLNQIIFFSDFGNQNIFLEKNHTPPFKLNGRSLRKDKNAIFYNVPEPKTNIKVDKINENMHTLKELAKNIDINLANDNITKLTRIGKKLEGEEKHRPLLVTFSNDDIKRTNFKNFVSLRSEDEVTGDNESGIKNISINHDMTSQGKGRVQSFNCRGYK